MIDLTLVGATARSVGGGFQIQFGLYLPGIRATDQFEVVVRIIHRDDRFDPTVAPQDHNLNWNAGSAYDLWSATIPVAPVAGTHYGTPGLYLYRFQLWWTPLGGLRQLITRWFTDPFAKATDIGSLAAVEVPAPAATFQWNDGAFKTPELDDLIVYELHVEQFNDTFQGVIDRLVYLKSLGVNCIELMPVTSPKLDFDWGYGPLHYFSPSAHFGGAAGLKRLVDAAHAAGMAVILDVVYQHVDPGFAYAQVYSDVQSTHGTPPTANPMIGNSGWFGPQPDYSRPFTQEYFALANRYWIDEYHVDGFRYDEVTDLYQGPTDTGYAKLAYDTYRYSLSVFRFQRDPNSYSRIIQCAEALWIATVVLRQTYTNAVWQNDLLSQAEGIAAGSAASADLAHTLDPFFGGRYPDTKTVVNAAGNPVEMPVAPFQYLNSHDHSFLSVFTGTTGSGVIPPGDRSQFWRIQPLVIALYTCQGIPMLWEGEEFNEDFHLPDDGSARVNLRRDTHWEYFYDNYGVPLVRLYRRLGTLRRSVAALRSRQSFYYWQQSLQGTQLLAYHRRAPASGASPESYAMVLLNFGSSAATLTVPFPSAGLWTERLDEDVRAVPWTINVVNAGDVQAITVPSNYGCVFIR
jgi:maltooligosyltrehalose trehalohydrolase